ncbi:TPA: YadA-like family protein, partial [Escherichia coli]|nr:YadA-like family protein [Escherichia coli]
MSKKFTKTVLSTAMAGVLFGVSFGSMSADVRGDRGDLYNRINSGTSNVITKAKTQINIGKEYKLVLSDDGLIGHILDKNNNPVLPGINTKVGSVLTWNDDDAAKVVKLAEELAKNKGVSKSLAVQIGMETIMYPVDNPKLKLEELKKITVDDVKAIKEQQQKVSGVINAKNKDVYVSAVRSGGNSDAALAMAKNGPGVLQEYNRVVTNIDELNKSSNFYLDEGGNITLENNGSYGSVSVKETVAGLVDDTTVSVAEDGSLTMDRSTSNTKRVNEALVDLDKSVKDRTTVGMNSDGSLTTAEGAAKTVAVSEGLVSLSGRTDRIDAAVGGIDTRVTKNTQAIQNHSRQLQEHNARLNSQQRQIRENHEEMKRAAAQSAALSGLFQPYSVGKFNATAALGGYSDKQAVAVGVGYRFNEQTAAKAGIAASDG